MISFNLICAEGHQFEGWFRSSEDYDDQQMRGLMACPLCNNTQVSKTLMTPNIGAKSNTQAEPLIKQVESARTVMSPPPEITPPKMPPPEILEAAAEMMAEMRKIQKTIEAKCDDVGGDFANEARKIHYGEIPPRRIYGKTSDSEAKDLVEEGIEITAVPWLPKEQ
ncbi:MAG: DUF1178 family protein [Candidatus Puniceispirillales bacterium WSBS_2018_MAG_OTU23]